MADRNIAEGCVDSTLFYTKLMELKKSKKAKSSKTAIFIENEFFDESKSWLEATTEGSNQLNLNKLTKQITNYKKQLETLSRRKGHYHR